MKRIWTISAVVLASGCQSAQEWNSTEVMIFNYKHMQLIKSGLLGSSNQYAASGFSKDLKHIIGKYENLRTKQPTREVDLLLAENKEINERLVFWGFPELVRTPTKSDRISPRN